MLTRIRRYRLALLPVLALGLALSFAACGGSDSDDAQKKLDDAFKKSIKSADVTVDVEALVSGLPLGGGGFKGRLSGPYQSNGPDKLPSLDFDISVSGIGQNISAGIAATADNVYVTYQGQAYELGANGIKDLDKNLQTQREKGKQDDKELSAAGINPANWVTDAKSEGDAKVAGTDTEHISAKVDLDKLFDDANKLVENAPDVGGQIGERVPEKLTDNQKDALSSLVKDPTVDVYVGKDDGFVHRRLVRLQDHRPRVESRPDQRRVRRRPLDLGRAQGHQQAGHDHPARQPQADQRSHQAAARQRPWRHSRAEPPRRREHPRPRGRFLVLGLGLVGFLGLGIERILELQRHELSWIGHRAGHRRRLGGADAKKFQDYAKCIKGAGTDADKVASCTQKLR